MTRLTGIFQSGFSMVELSVATAVFSMGLGSLSLMMLSAVHGTVEARHRTVATTQASSLAEVITMHPGAHEYYIDPPSAAALGCSEEPCADDALAADNLLSWQNHLARALPGSNGLVCRDSTPDDGDLEDPSCDGTGALVVKVFWKEPRHEAAADGGQRRVVSAVSW